MNKQLIKNASAIAGLIILAILVLLLIGTAINIFLMILAGALIAIFFRAIGDLIHKKLQISKGVSLFISVVLILGILVGLYFLLAPRVNKQFEELSKTAPKGIEQIKGELQDTRVGSFILEQIPGSGDKQIDNQKVQKRVTNFLSTTFGVLGDLYIIIFFGLFFMATPKLYVSGIVALFPKCKRERVWQVMNYSAFTLKRWLIGKLLSMLVVAILTATVLYILGIPLALTLGLIAGLLSFVPNFGPLIALIPAAAVAITIGPTKLLYVILAYALVQALESNLITPFIQKKNIDLPFAIILFSQVLLGVYTGLLGIILATPLMALLIVWVQMIYVHDVLHDYDTKLLGQQN